MIRQMTQGIRLPLLLGAAALLLYPLLFGTPYTLRILTVAGIYALLVIGYQFIFGHAGALALTQGTFLGLASYVTGILSAKYGYTFAVTFPLSVIAPILLALIVAAPTLRLESHYFALATLGIGQVMWLIAIKWEPLTGGANGIPGVPGVILFGWAVPRGWPMLLFVWSFVAVGALAAWQITRGLYGRAFALMRENPIAASAMGFDTARLRFSAFMLSAIYAGVCGALYVHTIRVISPEVLDFHIMVSCLTMAVVGGRSRVAGAILGAVLLIHLPEWFRFLEKYYLIAYGLIMLAAIIAAPEGIIGAIERLRARLLPEVPPAPPSPLPMPLPGGRRPSSSAPLLEVDDLSKAFGGVRALEGVSFSIAPGTILGLIGPNGSGKTTLVNVVTGLYRPDGGRVRLAGTDITHWAPHAIARAGIARTFQTVNLVDEMTALDAVAVARAGHAQAGLRAALLAPPGDPALRRAQGEAMGLLNRLGIGDVATRLCGGLPYGVKRKVEIARALALEPRLMLLDEPAAGLNDAEQAELAAILRRLADDGLTLLVIEHNMPFLMPLAERMVCLDHGEVIAAGSTEEVRRHPRVIEAYLGSDAAAA